MSRSLHLLVLVFIAGSAYSIFGQTNVSTHICGARFARDKPFLEAVRTGDGVKVERLLQKGADVNLKDDCNTPVITLAADVNRSDILKMLIEAGADVNVFDEEFYRQPPLLWAIGKADNATARKKIRASVQTLIAGGADVNLPGKSEESALMAAVLAEDERLVEMLIAAGANVNYKDSEAQNAYSYAAKSGNKNIKKILIENGADTAVGVKKYAREYGENAFFQAAADGRTDVVEAMLADGADVNAVNSGGMTALMRAAEKSTFDLLLNAGTDVNIKDNAGFTALIWAAAFRRNDQVERLVEAGADVNARTNDGKQALDFITDETTRDFLIKTGARVK